MGDRGLGLNHRYIVERVDGAPVGHAIVLELKDPNSWPALLTWADTVQADGYFRLALEVRQMVKKHQEFEETKKPER